MTPEQPRERACSRPCYDCPFRKDAASYPTFEQFVDNLRRTLVDARPQHCHHSLMDASEGTWLPPGKAKPRLCGGHSIFLHKLGLRPLPPEVKDGFDLVVDSIGEFARLGSMYAKLPKTRWWVWWSLQPRQVRERLARE